MKITSKMILLWILVLLVIQMITARLAFKEFDMGIALTIKQNELIIKQLQINENKLDKILHEIETVIVKTEKPKTLQQNFETVTLSVPNNNCNKTYMDYRAITLKTSPQYKLQSNPNVYTNPQGLRMLNDCYIVAVGTYYGNSIGDRLIVNMKNGKTFNAVVGDFKSNKHTDKNNKQHTEDGSVIEFIVDTKTLHPLSGKMGDVSYAYEGFKGEIESIERIVKSD